MTKQEFYKYVESFGKKAGEYTTAEMVQIGLKHKTELSLADKNWQELCDILGWQGSKDSFRMYINHRESSASDSETLRDVDRLYVAKTQVRDVYNAYRRTLRDEARIEDLKSTILEAANMQKSLCKINKVEIKDQKSEGILLLGDWHIGQETDNFYNKYNKEIAKARISKVVAETIHYCKLHKVHTLHVINLGDLIEGIINTNARIEQEMDVCSEIMYASEFMAEALNLLQEAAPVITYRSCTDNHSRAVADKHQNIAKENFNKIVDWYVEERLKDTDIKFPKDNLDPGLGRFALKNGMKVAFFHGHEGSAKSATLQELAGATREWTDIACCGHWHNPAEHVYQNMRLFINNSLCGTGPYALSKRYFTEPSQKLIIIQNKNFLNIDISAN